ncbi:MAG TPA: glycoside hydrolase family 20 zincin-like fold domain-containing protein, partial [Pyrinomonadaceae bacterium]|nr:glycoside hydrolase family 20 zincin-like fold domain-containing protein [Pyrinomonadaceae bacterium]
MSTTLTRTLIVRLAIVCSLGAVSTSLYGQPATLKVIPAPKQVSPTESEFRIKRETRVVLEDSKSAEDRFAAEDFVTDLKLTADVTLKIGGGRSSEILIGLIDRPRIQQALKRGGFDPTAQALTDEGYLLTVGRKQIVVAGKTTTGTFYGLQTLKQLVLGEG